MIESLSAFLSAFREALFRAGIGVLAVVAAILLARVSLRSAQCDLRPLARSTRAVLAALLLAASIFAQKGEPPQGGDDGGFVAPLSLFYSLAESEDAPVSFPTDFASEGLAFADFKMTTGSYWFSVALAEDLQLPHEVFDVYVFNDLADGAPRYRLSRIAVWPRLTGVAFELSRADVADFLARRGLDPQASPLFFALADATDTDGDGHTDGEELWEYGTNVISFDTLPDPVTTSSIDDLDFPPGEYEVTERIDHLQTARSASEGPYVENWTQTGHYRPAVSGNYLLSARGDDLLDVTVGPLHVVSVWDADKKCIDPDPATDTAWLRSDTDYPFSIRFADKGGVRTFECSLTRLPGCSPKLVVDPHVIEISPKWSAADNAIQEPDVRIENPCSSPCTCIYTESVENGDPIRDGYIRKVTYTLLHNGEEIGSDCCLYVEASEKDREDDCTSCCSEGTDVANDCVSFSQKFGRTPQCPHLPAGRVVVSARYPHDSLRTPSALKYDHPMMRRLFRRDGLDAIVLDGLGNWIEYRDGEPVNASAGLSSRLFHDGHHCIERLADGLEVVYSRENVAWLKTPYGERIPVTELGIDVVRDPTTGAISSISSVADGTMSVSGTEDGEWTLDWTSPAGSHVKSFTFRNLIPSIFTLIESRDETFTFTNRWVYSEADKDWTFWRGYGSSAETCNRRILTFDSATRTWNATSRMQDAGGNVLREHSSEVVLDGAARTTSRSDALGSTYSARRGAKGFIASETDERGAERNYVRDRYGRITEKRETYADRLERKTTYVYAFGSAHDIDPRPVEILEQLDGITVSHEFYDYEPHRRTRMRTFGRTTRTSFTEYDEKGRVVLSVGEDGRAVRTLRTDLDETGGWTETEEEGIWDPAAQAFVLVDGKSTSRVSLMGAQGNATNVTERAYIGGVWRDVRSRAMTYDVAHRVTSTVRSDGKTSAAEWICTGPVRTCDTDGIVVSNFYNGVKAKRLSRRYGPFGVVETAFAYDAEGRLVSETDRSDDAPDAVRTLAYDARGRIVSETDRTGRITATAYSADNRTTTRTFADGGTESLTLASDGQLLSVTGTADVPRFLSYGVTPDGLVWTRTDYGTAESERFETVYRNAYGEAVREERSGANGSVITTVREYDARGRLIRETTDGEPERTFAYDAWGDLIATTESADGVSRTVRESEVHALIDGEIWRTETQSVEAEGIEAIGTSSRTQLSGLSLATEAHTIAVDRYGKVTMRTKSFDPLTHRHTSVLRTESASNEAREVSCDGLGVETTSLSGVTQSFDYTSRGLRSASTDGRGNVTTYLYDEKGNLTNETDAAGFSASYGYDAMNRCVAATNRTGDVCVYEYDHQGRTVYEGGATYPVRYTYDIYGNRTSMTTYRDASSQQGDVTTWLYDIGSGLVTNKVYADGHGTVYRYDANGRLTKRIWARGIETDYSYDGFGNLTRTDYSDETPDVEIAYDALGRKTRVTDVKGVTEYVYDDFGDEASIATTGLYEKTLLRHRDAYGRDIGHTLDGSRKNEIAYDPATGRIARTKLGGAWYDWSYLPGTDLKSSLTIGTAATTTWSYEPTRDLLTQVRTEAFGNVVSQYDYAYDAEGRRTSIARSGTAMSEARTDDYGYNPRGELVSATKRSANEVLGASSRPDVDGPSSDPEYAYQYDDIGNRLTSVEPARSFTYTANNLNQYTTITPQTPQTHSTPQTPLYDLDGNQTLIRTSTGDWQVTYNGENRPVLWTCQNNSNTLNSNTQTTLRMTYDFMGRRVELIETEESLTGDGLVVTNLHQKFVYDNYLCIQRLNGADDSVTDTFEWDPTEPVATRPLFWQLRESGQNPRNFFYTHDGNKNVSEVISYQSATGLAAHYEYAPFGETLVANTLAASVPLDLATRNPWRFSSEYIDKATASVYFNFRHCLFEYGRWSTRDPSAFGLNYYLYLNNQLLYADFLGLWQDAGVNGNRRLYKRECGDAFEQLAEITGLSITDVAVWAQAEDDIGCVYSVPNVWIDADLLQGPAELYDHVVNIGGSLGSFVSTDLLTWKKKIVKVNSVDSFLNVVDEYRGDIWGMQVFAHGDPDGNVISMPWTMEMSVDYESFQNKRWMNQVDLIKKIELGGYKIARAYMMQCYSGANGYQDKWSRVSVDFYGFSGMNVFGLDMASGYWPWNWSLFKFK